MRNSLPRPNWTAITDWLNSNFSNHDLDKVWSELAVQWLELLIDALPNGYSLSNSEEFYLLSDTESEKANGILRMCEISRRVILETLPGVARDEGYGKHVVLAFGSTDLYYDYISDFYPEEGNFGLSGGTFFDEGYGHLALCMACTAEHDRVITHELTHALLRHLPLPLWLNEGVTQVAEDTVAGSISFTINNELANRHREYWNSESIHAFWSGDSFYHSDDGQELSYHLAQVLFRNLMSDFPKQILRFLSTANFADAGNKALIELCNVSLGDRVAQFLGEDQWSPRTVYFDLDAHES